MKKLKLFLPWIARITNCGSHKTFRSTENTTYVVIFLLFLSFNGVFAQSHGLSYDGVDDYVEISSDASLNMGGSSFTVEFWVKSSQEHNSEVILFEHGNGTWSEGTYLITSGNQNEIGVNFYGASSVSGAVATVDWTDNVWHHIAGVFDNENDKLRLYMDGELLVEEAETQTPDNVNLNTYIGSRGGSSLFAEMEIDEIRVWNVARTTSQIQANIFNNITESETGLVAYYKMSDGSGTSLTDDSSNSNAGTLSGGTSWINDIVTAVPFDTDNDSKLEISTGTSLIYLSQNNGLWGDEFLQIANIIFDEDETNVDWDGDGTVDHYHSDERYGFQPIGDNIKNFTGKYDGQGNKIDNLYIGRGTSIYDNIGLFGWTDGAEIKNINLPNVDVAGNSEVGALIGYSTKGTLVDNCTSTGYVEGLTSIGGLVGTNSGSTIQNSSSSCNVLMPNTDSFYAGGLAGKHTGLGALIQNCFANANVTPKVKGEPGECIGGLVGYVSADIMQCYSTSDVDGYDQVGGFAGYVNDATISNCYITGSVFYYDAEGTSFGAFVGFTSFSTIEYCYSIGDVYAIAESSVSDVGAGFAGTNSQVIFTANVCNSSSNQSTGEGATAKTETEMKIAQTFIDIGWDFCESGTSSGGIWTLDEHPSSPDNDGSPALAWQGLTNYQVPDPPEVTNGTGASSVSTYSVTLHGEVINTGGEAPTVTLYWGDNDGGTGTWDNSIDMSTQSGAFQTDISGLSPVTTYYYRCFAENSGGSNWANSTESFTTSSHFAGSGTEADPYQIQNTDDLKTLSENSSYWDKYFIQTANIDFNTASPALSEWNGNTGWSPVGNLSTNFTGNYDGGGYTISNIIIDRTQDYQGLFGYSLGATITDVNINNAQLTVSRYSAGLIGYADNTTITNARANNVTITGERGIGALVGFFTGGSEITQCSASGETRGNGASDIAYQGGLVGIVENNGGGSIRRSFANVNVASNTGARVSGGLVGLFRGDGLIENCYAIGNVYGRASTGTNGTGGLVGRLGDTDDTNAIINDSYATGQVAVLDGTTSPVLGGLLGYQVDGTLVQNSLWDTESSSENSSAAGTGKTTAEMKTYATFNNAGWDFMDETSNGSVDEWGINSEENDGYPFLAWQGFTNSFPPIVSTQAVTSIGTSSATGNGNITQLGVPNPSAHGMCYNTTGSPNINDDSVVDDGSASSAGAYTSNLSGLTPNMTYYARAFATNTAGTGYGSEVSFSTLPASESTFTGPGNWSDAEKWSNGIPGNATTVTVSSGTLSVDGDYECADMTINSGAVVSIDPENTLTVAGTLTNNAGTSGLILQSDGTGTGMLINSSTSTSARVEQYLVKDQWHYMGIPVSTVTDVDNVMHNCLVLSSDEASGQEGTESGWQYLVKGDALTSGTGYAVQYTRSGSENDTTVTFTGQLNTGNITINLDHTDTDHGWNLISNPYPCTMDWESGITLTNTQDAIYLWDPVGETYKSYVNGSSSNGQTQNIPPMQGFFVRSVLGSASVELTNSTKNSTDVNFKSEHTDPLIRLAITKDGIHDDETLIRVSAEATNQFDDSFDAWKIKASTSKTPQLYSVTNGDEYSINSIPVINAETYIPLEMLIKSDGEHSLNLIELSNYSYHLPLKLFSEEGDLVANIEVEDYLFEAEKGESIKLILGFTDKAVGLNELIAKNVYLYTKGSLLTISGLAMEPTEILIHHTNGQCIYREHKLAESVSIPIDKNGMYLVSVLFENGTRYNGKVIINQ